jgi:hypothetical protein
MPLAPIALSFVYSRPFVSSTIIGATSLQQLEDNVMALNVMVFSVVRWDSRSNYETGPIISLCAIQHICLAGEKCDVCLKR